MSRLRALRRGIIVMLKMNGGDHPHVALTDPVKFPGRGKEKIILVPMTTSARYSDEDGYDLIAVPDEHIAAGSHAIYINATLRDVAELKDEIRKHNRKLSVVAPEVLRFLCEGLLKSDAAHPIMKDDFLHARKKGKAG